MAAVGTLTIEMAANVARLQRDMERATKTVGGAMDRIQRSVQTATRALGALTAAFAAYKTVQGILQQADAMTQLNSRLQLVTRSQEEFIKTQNALVSISQRSYTSLGATVDLYTALARSTANLGVSQNELLRVVETFNKSIIISGGSVQAAEAAITQFNQAMASGVLRGEEFNSISEQAPMIMELLSSSLGVTRGALRDMAKEGLLVAELVLPALIDGSKGVDEQFSTMTKTVGQAGQQFKNSFALLIDAMNNGLEITSVFASAIDTLRYGVEWLTKVINASQGDLSGYIDTQAESAKFARQQAEAMKEQEEAVKSRARAMLEEKERMEEAKKAADELQKSYDKLLDSLRGDLRGSTAALQAEQQGLNKAQEEFLKLVSGPEWKQYSAAQKIIITDLYKQRIETEKLIEAEKARAKAAEDRLKKMMEDEKEFREELAKEDKKNEEDRIKAQEKLYEEHRKQIERIEDDLTDALMRAFESGKGFGQAFKDTLVNMFRTMVLRPVLAPIAGAFAGAFGGGGAMAAGAGGLAGGGAGMGFLSGLGAASSALGVGIAAGFSNALQMNFAGSLTMAGRLIGTGAMSSITQGIGMAAGTLLPIVGAISLIPSIGRALFGGGRRTTATGITGTFTTGGASVMAFEDWRRSGGLFRRSRSGTNYSAIGGELQMFLDQSLISISQATRSYANILGLNADAINGITQQVRINLTGLSAEQQQQEIANALNSFADELAKQYLGIASPFIQAGETAGEALGRLAISLSTANQAFDTMNVAMYESSLAAANMASQLMDIFGGTEQFITQTSFYYSEFYSEAERIAITTRQLSTIMGELGLILPQTRDEFRRLVEAQDLTTQAGREMYAMFIGLAPAFAEITKSADEAYQQAGNIINFTDKLAKQYLANFQGVTTETEFELGRLATSLATVNQAFNTMNVALYEGSLAAANMASQLINIFGGTEQFITQTSFYYSEFYSEAERVATTTRQLSTIMGELGFALPQTRDEFRRLVEAQDLTTQAGREMYAMLIGLAPTFAEITRSADEAYQQAQNVTNLALSALERSVEVQRRSLEVNRQLAEENVNSIRSVFDTLNSAINSLTGGGFTAITGMAFIEQALQTARATGYLPDAAQLSSAIGAVTTGLGADSFATSFEQRKQQGLVIGRLTDLREFSEEQLTEAEKQLAAAEEQIERLDAQLEAQREQILIARQQVTGIEGVTGSVLTVAQAISQMEATLRTEISALRSMQTAAQAAGSTQQQQLITVTGREKDAVSVATDLYNAAGASGHIGSQTFQAWVDYAAQNGAQAAITHWTEVGNKGSTSARFAAGGLHTGGMRLVGERGPELEFTGPARYMSNATLASMMNNGSGEEIRALREENKVQMRALVSLQNRMTKLLERWDGDGLPEERAVA